MDKKIQQMIEKIAGGLDSAGDRVSAMNEISDFVDEKLDSLSEEAADEGEDDEPGLDEDDEEDEDEDTDEDD